jgi:hypothetical protein
MPLPKYSDAIKDPFFANASAEEKLALNDKYWNAYQRENPGDKWGESQAQASRRALESTAALASADPLSKRALEFQRDQAETQLVVNNLDADGGWESPQQREQMIGQRKAELEAKRQQLDKTFSLFKPEVAKEMEPTWKALDRYASDSGYFGGEGGLKGAATVAADGVTFGAFSKKAAEDKVRYEKLRDTVSKDFNLAPEEVDDVMRHRLNKYEGDVSRDAFGTLHFKDSALVKNTDEIEAIVDKSNLPDQAKAKAKDEAPQRVALFKENVVQTAKQNFPELAKELGLGDDINENYRKIVDATNKSKTAQALSGVAPYALGRVGDVMWAKQKTTEDPFIGAVAGEFKKVAEDEAKRIDGINALSDKIQQDKVRIFGTDAASIGQGAASVVESVALTAVTGGAGNLIKAERIARAGKVGAAVLGGVKAGLTVAPTAAIYGGEQALDTWERASQSDDPAIRARAGELAAKSFLSEFGVTTGMSMIGLKGVEDMGKALASKATREAFAKSASAAVLRAADNFALAPISEAFEESLITALDAVHVQQQLNPDMTDEQVRKAIGDTIIATAFASGSIAGTKGTITLVGDVKNLSTRDKTTEELHDLSDEEYTARATQENLPEAETAGRAFPTSGPVSLAEIERERAAQIELTEDPEEKKTLAEAAPEELAGEWGVELKLISNRGLEIAASKRRSDLLRKKEGREPMPGEAVNFSDRPQELTKEEQEELDFLEANVGDNMDHKAVADRYGFDLKPVKVVGEKAKVENTTPPVTTPAVDPARAAKAKQLEELGAAEEVLDWTEEDFDKNWKGMAPSFVKKVKAIVFAKESQQPGAASEPVVVPAPTTPTATAAVPTAPSPEAGGVAAVATAAKTNGVDLRVEENKSGIQLLGITTDKSQQRKGRATAAITDLKRVADEKQLPISLTVEPSDEMSKPTLINWYSKQGFELQEDGETMIYTPEVDYDAMEAQDKALVDENPAQPSAQKPATPQLTTPTTNERKIEKTGRPAPEQKQPAQPAAEGQAQKGAAQREGEGQEVGTKPSPKPAQQPKAEAVTVDKTEDKKDLRNAPIEDIARAVIENPNDVNAALLVFAAAGTRPASLPGQEAPTTQPSLVQGELFQGVERTAGTVPSSLSKEQRNMVVRNIQKSKLSAREIVDVLARVSPSDMMAVTEKLDDTTLRRLTGGADNRRLTMLSDLRRNVNGRRAALPSSTNASPMQDDIKRKPVDRVAARVVGMDTLEQLPETHTPQPQSEIPAKQGTDKAPASDLSYRKLKANEAAFTKIVKRLMSHHVFRAGSLDNLSIEEIGKKILKQMTDNILFVYDSVPENIRTESKKWYKGANRIANMWSEQYAVSTESVAGVIAALSPQKDWFQNVSLAERVLDIWTGKNRKTDVFGPEMQAAAAKMDAAQKEQAKGKKYLIIDGVREELFEHGQRLKELTGRKFEDLGILDKAFFIRLYDETYNPRSYAMITPDGRFGKDHINKDGSPTKIAWGTVHMTASAVSMLENPSLDNISKELGHAHKIRSFYNNIINPDSDVTVTSDTHAVAVVYMMPLSGAAKEVTDNFGGITTDGYRGTYAFITEAYRLAAKKRGVKPSEMQSVTWEAIRDIFPAAFKRNTGKVDQLREMWNNFSRGRTKESYETIRQRAYEAGGGYSFPSWYQQPELGLGDSGTSWNRTSTYSVEDSGNQSDGLRSGGGRGNGRSGKGTGARTQEGRAAGGEQGTLFQDTEVGVDDQAYLAAVEAGDMEMAQRMVDEAARAAGFIIRGYHGTAYKFTVPKGYRGVAAHLTADKEIAEDFANAAAANVRDIVDREGDQMPYESTEPIVLNLLTKGRYFDPKDTKQVELLAKETGISKQEINQADYGVFEDARVQQSLKDLGYDGYYESESGNGVITSFAVFSPENIKSADPVTYDEQGNVIPLSQRFNPESRSILFQDTEGPKGTYTPKAVAAAQNVSNTVLGLIEGKADTTTGIHEAGHAIEDFLREIGEGEKADALEAWAKENVGDDWRKKREYIARGFERFVINGVKTGVESVDRAFARIAEIMLNIYKGIKGSSVDIDIPPNIEKIFNDLLSRGAKLEAEGKKPIVLPVDIKRQAPKPKAETKAKPQPAPKRKIPARKIPAPLPFGVKREDLDAARRRYGIPERQGMVVRMTDEESLDEAYARLAKRDKGDESALVGQELVLDLMGDNRGTNKVEVALLAIHGFEIQKALKDLDNKITKLDPGETQKRKAFETLQEALFADFQDLVNITQLQGSRAGLALQAMKLVANEVYSVDAMLRRRAIWKNTGKKPGQAKDPLTPAEMRDTEKQSKKILELIKERERLMKELEDKYNREEAAAIISKKEKDVAKERKPTKPRGVLVEKAAAVATSARDRLRAMGVGVTRLSQLPETPKKKVAALLDRSGNFLELASDETHAYKAQIALKEKGNSQDINKALQVALQSGFARVVVDGNNLYVDFGESKNTLTPSQRKALITHAESVGYTSITTDNYNGSKVVWEADTLFQDSESTQVEILDALSDVGTEYLAGNAKTIEAFTEKLVSEFGEEFRDQAETVFGLAKDKLAKLASTARQKTPQELSSLIDPSKGISEKMVYNMALGFMRQGLKGEAVLDAVTKLLQNDYPNLTREEVVVAFTNYGRVKNVSQEQLKVDIRELKVVERLGAQLLDIAKGFFPKKTGLPRDPTTSPVRSLMKQIKQAMIDAGMNYTEEQDKKTRLAGARDAIKRQLENQLRDMKYAIDERIRIDRPKRDPVTDPILDDLKKRRDEMLVEYRAIFGIDSKKISLEAQIKRASKMLDRQINLLEAEMRGEILDKPTKVKLDSPELKAKRERLESLREAKRIAQEARNPKKTAAEIATNRLYDSVNKSIERFEYFIKNGTYPPTAKGVAPTLNSVLKEMMATRDRLRDTVREIQKDRRILTPPEVIARRRAIVQLNKTIADLNARIAKRDFSKRAKKPESTDPAVRNLKATVVSLRATLDQLKKDALKPTSPEEKRIQRMIAASKKRKENYERRLAAGDFAKAVKRDTKEDSRLTQTKIDEAKAKAEWLEEGRKYAIANMSASQRFWHYVGGAFKLRKITTLGFELGIGMRQAYFYTLRAWANPIKVTTTFAKAFSGMFSRDKEIAYYNDVIDRPNSVYDKRMDLRFMSPFADLDRMQEADAIDPELMETINKKLPKFIPLRWVTELGLGVERFNRIVTNLTRAQMADTLIEKGIRDEGNPSKDELAIIGNAVMNATGRGSLKNPSLDAGLALANTVTISARWAVSRAKMNALEPIWTRRASFDGTMKIRATVAADVYGKAIVGRAILGTVIVGIVRAITPDDEEEDIVWNPTSGKFGGISYKGTMIDLGGGMRPYINLLAQGIMGYKLNSKGEVIPLRGEGSIGFGKQDFRDSLYDFVRNRENINMAMILDTITQKHFGDIAMTPTSFTRQLLEPIIVEDLVNIFETHGVRDGSVLATALFFGVGVRTPWEKTEKKEPEYNWIRF